MPTKRMSGRFFFKQAQISPNKKASTKGMLFKIVVLKIIVQLRAWLI